MNRAPDDTELIERIAREAMRAYHGGHDHVHGEPWPKTDRIAQKWESVAAAVARLIAEECAKLCDNIADAHGAKFEGEACADAIRAKFGAPT